MAMPPEEIEAAVREQMATLRDLAGELGLAVTHVKAHGALYHACSANLQVARAVGRAVLAINPSMILYTQAGAAALETWKQMGLRRAGEAFADRAYEPDGHLRDRKLAGAVLDASHAAEQAVPSPACGAAWSSPTELSFRWQPKPSAFTRIHPALPPLLRRGDRQLKAAGIEVKCLVA